MARVLSYQEKIQYDTKEVAPNLVGEYKNPKPVNFADLTAPDVEGTSAPSAPLRHTASPAMSVVLQFTRLMTR